jgi:hypothetical protein
LPEHGSHTWRTPSARRSRVGRAIMELIFLAATTELPKLVTTSAAVVSGNAAIALTHIFGGITMQATTLTVAAAAAHRFAGSKRESHASSASSSIPDRADRLARVSLGVLHGALTAKRHFRSSRIAEPRLRHPGNGLLLRTKPWRSAGRSLRHTNASDLSDLLAGRLSPNRQNRRPLMR